MTDSAASGDLVPLPALDGDGRGAFVHDGRPYAVFTVDAAVVVTDGTCPHKGGPLAEGLLRDGAIVCPWHWYTFDLTTGHCRNGDAGELPRHEVVQIAGRPHARIVAPPPRSWSALLRGLARGRP